MLLQSHSVNSSIETCVTHFLAMERITVAIRKNALCERALRNLDPNPKSEFFMYSIIFRGGNGGLGAVGRTVRMWWTRTSRLNSKL